MTEKEKMIQGLPYFPGVKELQQERDYAKNLCFELNATNPIKRQERLDIIKNLFGHVGDHALIESSFYCDYGYNIFVGNYFYSNHNCVILDCAKVTIGDHVLFGPNVGLYTASHPLNAFERNDGIEYAHPINIGNNVWIGADVTIVGGVTIGDNVVVGAGSVVTKDIPSNVLAYGNPCKVIQNI